MSPSRKNPRYHVIRFSLQVILKRISPAAVAAASAGITLASGRSGKSGTQSSAGGDSIDSEAKAMGAAAAAAQLAATAPGEVDGWAPPMASDALLIRGRLALLDGKLRVGGVSPESGPGAPNGSFRVRCMGVAVGFT